MCESNYPVQASGTWEVDGAWETSLCPRPTGPLLSTCPGNKSAPESKRGLLRLSHET